MDPAGIREIYLFRPFLTNPYQVEAVARDLPFKARVHPVYFANPWLPFSELLTQRVSRHSEGYTGWMQFDCAVLAGVDMQSARERDMQNLRSAVERGLPLFLCGGDAGLGNSYRLWHDLEASLPARIPPARGARPRPKVKPKIEVIATANDHPILRGLPRSFGAVAAVHHVEPSPDARVILTAGGAPLLLASERHGSRQLILAVEDADDLCCDALSGDGFYGHPFYPDLIRRCLAWLMKVEPPLWIETLETSENVRSAEDSSRIFHVGVKHSASHAGARIRYSVYGVDDARMASGGDTRPGAQIHEETRSVGAATHYETFRLDDMRAGKSSGVYLVELAAEMDNPPQLPPQECFGMALAPGWNNWKGNAVDTRRFFVRFPDRRVTKVFIPGRTFTLEETKSWRARLGAPDLAASRAEFLDASGKIVGRAQSDQPAGHELAWSVPPLANGDYRAVITAQRSGGVEEEFQFALRAVSIEAPDESFHLVTHGGLGLLNDEENADLLRVNLEEYGVDTIHTSAHAFADAIEDETTDWSHMPFAARRERWLDTLVAARGQHLWADFQKPLILLATHGGQKDYNPTEPCVHHPDYEKAVRERLAPAIRVLAERAGHMSTEIIDEPHLYASNLCRCEICLKMYKDRFNEEMPSYDEVKGDTTAKRWHLFQWMEDYTTKGFAAARRVKEQIAPQIHLHNTAIDRLFVSNFMFNAMHRWAAFGDELYMACYPWSYQHWRGAVQMPCNQTHWIAAYIRGLATQYRIPWGVFMELWEHDTPNRWLPEYWSVGQFYILLAEGADRLDTFLVCFGGEMFGISWTRLREFGWEVNKIRPFFPLLARTSRPRGRMAFVHPWAEWVMNPQEHYLPPGYEGYGYYRRYKAPFDKLYPSENRRMMAYELIHRTFPDLELVDENFIAEQEDDYHAIAVCDCTFLMRRTMARLLTYVQSGGVIVLDCRPDRDEEGNEVNFFDLLTQNEPVREEVIAPGLHCRVFRLGTGTVILFSTSLQTFYSDVVESERDGLRLKMESAVSALFADLGLEPRIYSANSHVDVGLRIGEGVALLPVANTSADAQSTTITLPGLPFQPSVIVNLTDGSHVDFSHDTAGIRFAVDLESYHGALIAIWPDSPDTCLLDIATPACKPGENMVYEITLDYGRRPIAGSFIVDVKVKDAEGTEHPGLGGTHVAEGGYLRIEKKLPVNAAAGIWTIEVSEPVLGLSVTGSVAVSL